jgi:hypothetical protein
MISREQAERAGDAMLASARTDQEKAADRNTLMLVRMYPALKHVAPLDRQAVLDAARGAANIHVGSRLLLASVTLAFAAYIAMNLSGHADDAMVAGWLAACTFIAGQFLEQFLMRRYIRQWSKERT